MKNLQRISGNQFYSMYGTFLSDDFDKSDISDNQCALNNDRSFENESNLSIESNQSSPMPKSLRTIKQQRLSIVKHSKEQQGQHYHNYQNKGSRDSFSISKIKQKKENLPPIQSEKELRESVKEQKEYYEEFPKLLSEKQINLVNQIAYKSPKIYLQEMTESDNHQQQCYQNFMNSSTINQQNEQNILESQNIRLNDLISPTSKNLNRKRANTKQDYSRQYYESHEVLPSSNCINKLNDSIFINNNLQQLMPKSIFPNENQSNLDINIPIQQKLESSSQYKSYSNIKNMEHNTHNTNLKNQNSIASIEKHPYLQTKDPNNSINDIQHGNGGQTISKIQESQNYHQQQSPLRSQYHAKHVNQMMQRSKIKQHSMQSGYPHHINQVNGGQATEGHLHQHQLNSFSQQFTNFLDFFDLMRLYKKFFPHNNYDKVLLKVKTQYKQAIKQKQVGKQNKKKFSIIGGNQFKNNLKERANQNNTYNLQDLQQPTFLSYGVSMHQNKHPTRKNLPIIIRF